MVETINASTQAAMDNGFVSQRHMIKLELGSGTYGLHNGGGSFSYDGVVYQGAGSLIEVEAFTSVSDGSAVKVVTTLNSMENSELSPDVLATMFNEQYSQKPVTFYTQFTDPDTRAVTQTEVEWAGYIDTIEEERTSGGESKLLMTMESRSRDFTRKGYRRRSDADQREIDANDGSLRHVHVAATQKIYLGRATPKTA